MNCVELLISNERMSKSPMTTALITNNLPIPSALGSLDAYISAVNQVPVLTVEEEQALARAYRDDEDLDAAKSLIMSHLRFVVHVARATRATAWAWAT